MIKAFLLALFLALGIAVPIKPILVQGIDPGGNIGTYVDWWRRIADSGATVVIDGACISACTLVLGQVPDDRICMTDRGSFGFHQASNEDGPNPELTELFVRTLYPKWVQEWIEKHGPLPVDPIYVTEDDPIFSKHIRKCTPQDLGTQGVTT